MSLDNFNSIINSEYAIAFNGGFIYNAQSKLTISESLIDAEVGRDLLLFLKQYSTDVVAYYDNRLWLDSDSEIKLRYAARSKLKPSYIDDLRKLAFDINKALVISDSPELLARIEADFKRSKLVGALSACYSSKRMLEFNPINIDKGSAISDFCSYLGIDASKTIAIGDNQNDIPMLCAAGLGIATQNATEETKNSSDYITIASNDDNAIAEVINKFCL